MHGSAECCHTDRSSRCHCKDDTQPDQRNRPELNGAVLSEEDVIKSFSLILSNVSCRRVRGKPWRFTPDFYHIFTQEISAGSRVSSQSAAVWWSPGMGPGV